MMTPTARAWAAGATIWLGTFLSARLLVAALPGAAPLLGYAVSFLACGGAAAAACGRVLSAPLGRRAAWTAFGLALACWLAGNGLLTGTGLGHLLGSTALVCLALLAGRAVGERVARAGYLLPVALVASAADLWSVLAPAGVTSAVVERPEILPLLVLTFPYVGAEGYAPLLGAADVCVVSLYLHVAGRFGLPARRSAAAVILGLIAALAAVLVLARPIPALPMLAGSFIVLHWRAMHLTHKEWRSLAVFLLLMASVAALLRLMTE